MDKGKRGVKNDKMEETIDSLRHCRHVMCSDTGRLQKKVEEQKKKEEQEQAAKIPKGDKYIALTFDDGPTGNEGGRTERLLDGLKQRNAHATFFLCGYRVKDFNSMMKRYLAEGHEVGNHTMDHRLA